MMLLPGTGISPLLGAEEGSKETTVTMYMPGASPPSSFVRTSKFPLESIAA